MRAFVFASLALAGLGGCVVPVGPEWTDPQSNSPPTIHSANPPVGSILAPDPGGASVEAEIVLADNNTDDDLFVRWLVDYPPFDETVSRLAYETTQPGGADVVRPRLRFAPSCGDDQIAPDLSSHRLMVAASDRPFLAVDPAQPVLDAVPDGGLVVRAMWQFQLACP